jgi:hypothetical protein
MTTPMTKIEGDVSSGSIRTSPGGGAATHIHSEGHVTSSGSLRVALVAVGVHKLTLFGVTGVVAIVVYEWVGVTFLRRARINSTLIFIWTIALVATGLILFATARY